MKPPPTPWRFYLFLGLAAILLLAGCGANVEQSITFYPSEAWEADLVLGIPREAAALLGSTGMIQQQLEEGAAAIQTLGAEASWESRSEEGELRYIVHAKGTGLQALADVAFDGAAELFVTVEGGRRQIHIAHQVSGDLLDAASNTITLVGGGVISSNGREIESGTVQWTNPAGRIEAVLTEKSQVNFGLVFLAVGVVAVVGIGSVAGAGWLLNRRRARRGGPCRHCGTWLPANAQFCHQCGRVRESGG